LQAQQRIEPEIAGEFTRDVDVAVAEISKDLRLRLRLLSASHSLRRAERSVETVDVNRPRLLKRLQVHRYDRTLALKMILTLKKTNGGTMKPRPL
jgi:hypothetical protein